MPRKRRHERSAAGSQQVAAHSPGPMLRTVRCSAGGGQRRKTQRRGCAQRCHSTEGVDVGEQAQKQLAQEGGPQGGWGRTCGNHQDEMVRRPSCTPAAEHAQGNCAPGSTTQSVRHSSCIAPGWR